MKSYLTDDFISHFQKLPVSVRDQARKNYRLWKENPFHPSLQFKRIHTTENLYSIRVGRNWRALGFREGDAIYWDWIGSHAEYNQLLANL